MKIAFFDLYEYSLPLTKPYLVRGREEMSTRDGILVCLRSDLGKEGWGEVAPLPGFSNESLDQAREQLNQCAAQLTGKDIPSNLEKLGGGLDLWFQPFNLLPSVHFGLETAVLNLLATTENTSLSELIAYNPLSAIATSALIDAGTKESIGQQVAGFLENGYTSFKIKVSKNFDEEIKKIEYLSNLIGTRAKLHLDANQTWDINGAIKFCNEVGLDAVTYIEEPFENLEIIPEFSQKTAIPVALDESLQHLTIQQVARIEGVTTIILKPTILGGIEKINSLIKEARQLGLKCVISSTFESEIGIHTLANLAVSLAQNLPAGLDTLKWFKESLLKEPLLPKNGKIEIDSETISSDKLWLNRLKKI